jgi:hypothetical protein
MTEKQLKLGTIAKVEQRKLADGGQVATGEPAQPPYSHAIACIFIRACSSGATCAEYSSNFYSFAGVRNLRR